MTYKTLIITVVIFSLVGLGIGLFVLKKVAPPSVSEVPVGSSNPFPIANDTSGAESLSTQKTPSASAASNASTTPQTQSSLRQLVVSPASGYVLFDKGGGSTVRYVDRASGHLEEITLAESVPTKITDTTITKTFRTEWGGAGNSLLLQLFSDKFNAVQTVFAQVTTPLVATSTAVATGDSLPSPSSSPQVGELRGVTLPASIIDMAVSPDRKRIFYLLSRDATSPKGSAAGSVGVVVNFDNSASLKGELTIFNSSLTEWLAQWGAPDAITLTSRPSSGVPGVSYLLHPSTHTQETVLSGVAGLTTLTSPDAKKILYASAKENSLTLYLLDRTSNTRTPMPVQTVPEKCVFSRLGAAIYCAVPGFLPNASYPDDWYTGAVQFSDALWKIDLKNFTSALLINPSAARKDQTIDAVNLQLTGKEDALAFMNKRNGSIWTLTL